MNDRLPTPQNILWDLMESEADEAYFLDQYEKDAELPGLLLFGPYSVFSHGKNWTLYFGEGIASWDFSSRSKARAKVDEIISHAKWEVYPRRRYHSGKIERLNKGYPVEAAPERTLR